MAQDNATDDAGKYELEIETSMPAFERLIVEGDESAANDLTRSEAEWCVAYMSGMAPEGVRPDDYSIDRKTLRAAAKEMRNADLESAGYADPEDFSNGAKNPSEVSFREEYPVDPDDFSAGELEDMAREIGVSYQGSKDVRAENINQWFENHEEESDDEYEITESEIIDATWDEIEAEFEVDRNDYENKEAFKEKFYGE